MSRPIWLLTLFGLACGPGLGGGSHPAPAFALAITQPSSTLYAHDAVDLVLQVTGQPERVDLLLDGVVLATVASPYHYHWDVLALPEATHLLTARLTAGTTQLTSDPRTVIIDHTAPTVTSTSPRDGSTAVELTAPIQAVFSEPLSLASVVDANVGLATSAGPVSKTLALSPDGRTLTVTPSQRVALPTQLTLSLRKGLTDLAGNALAASQGSWSIPAWTELDVQAWGHPHSHEKSYLSLDVLPDGRLGAGAFVDGRLESGAEWQAYSLGQRYLTLAGGFNALGDFAAVTLYATFDNCAAWSLDVYRSKSGTPLAPERVEGAPLAVGSDNFCDPPEVALTFTSSGAPYVAFHSHASPVRTFEAGVAGWNTGPVFQAPPGNDGGTSSPSIVLDNQDAPIAAWVQNQHAWIQRPLDPQAVDLTLLIPGSSVASSTSLVRDASGTVFVLVTSANGLAVLESSSTGWRLVGAPIPPSVPDDAILRGAISLDAKGGPVVAWTESAFYPDQGSLSVKHWIGGSWESVPLTSGGVFTDVGASEFALVGNWHGHLAIYAALPDVTLTAGSPLPTRLWRSEEGF